MFDFSRLGLEVTENANLVGSQISPVVAGFAGGGFVAVWTTTDTAQDGAGRAIKMQLIGANGAKVGGEILVNAAVTGDQILPVLGTEGALVAGWGAAKVACAIAGKKKDYLRDEVVGAAS